MGDLKEPRWMFLKAALFLGIGILAGAGILIEDFSLSKLALLLLAIWAFCRLYYFCFYVIEKYIDADFKFASLSSVLVYLWRRRS
jgi:hypothetical protein